MDARVVSDSEALECWRGFVRGGWCETIDVRGFIVTNVTPYDGDENFLTAASDRTQAVRRNCSHISRTSGKEECWPSMRAHLPRCLRHKAGYIDRDNELIVRLQTDQPFKRAILPYGGLRMVETVSRRRGSMLTRRFMSPSRNTVRPTTMASSTRTRLRS